MVTDDEIMHVIELRLGLDHTWPLLSEPPHNTKYVDQRICNILSPLLPNSHQSIDDSNGSAGATPARPAVHKHFVALFELCDC